MSTTTTHTIKADGINIFYRQAGPLDGPVLLLLHGFPSSSFQYRSLLAHPDLASKYRLIAPDLPGFGLTEVPAERNYSYTFDNLAKTIESFVDALKHEMYALYVFDYGAPTGFRLALSRPEAITVIISQNGATSKSALGPFWDELYPYWQDPSAKNREAISYLTSFEATKTQYHAGEAHPELISPEPLLFDTTLMTRPGNADIQLDLLYDYRKNVELYPTIQAYLTKHQPPLLAVWGRNDPIFIPAGAEAFKEWVSDAEVELIDGGHFVLESHTEEVVKLVRSFLDKKLGA